MKKEVNRIIYSMQLDIVIPENCVYITKEAYQELNDDVENVKNKYFDKEKIESIKKELCRNIMESENPFIIYDTDFDTLDVEDVEEKNIWK